MASQPRRIASTSSFRFCLYLNSVFMPMDYSSSYFHFLAWLVKLCPVIFPRNLISVVCLLLVVLLLVWLSQLYTNIETTNALHVFYQTTRRHNPEDSCLHTRRRENLKSYLNVLASITWIISVVLRGIQFSGKFQSRWLNVLVRDKVVTTFINKTLESEVSLEL
jgi:hypothetical protein